jgi:imidazolonepropionase-like amidohydrolase
VRAAGQGDRLGRLDVGAHADLIAVPEHPLDDITTLTRSSLVMAAGSIARHDPI